MKKLSLLCLIIFSFFFSAIHAQKVKLGIKGKRSEGELQTTSPKFNNVSRYYKDMPFDLKAGQAVVFFMQTTTFTPLVVLMGKNGNTFGTQRELKTEKGTTTKEARVVFTTQTGKYEDPNDSSFRVVFTSVEENATGKFIYGYKLIDSAQMIYNDEPGFFCNRLSYLINHWQAGWDIIPGDLSEQKPHINEFTDLCLMPKISFSDTRYGRIGKMLYESTYEDSNCTYQEKLFTSADVSARLKFYKNIVDSIKQCLGETNWVFEEITIDDSGIVYDTITKRYVRRVTLKDAWLNSFFYIKGAVRNQKHASFRILMGWKKEDDKDVMLIFN